MRKLSWNMKLDVSLKFIHRKRVQRFRATFSFGSLLGQFSFCMQKQWFGCIRSWQWCSSALGHSAWNERPESFIWTSCSKPLYTSDDCSQYVTTLVRTVFFNDSTWDLHGFLVQVGFVNSLAFAKSGKFLVAGIGQVQVYIYIYCL